MKKLRFAVFLKSILLIIAFTTLVYSSYRLFSYNKVRWENEKLAKNVLSESVSRAPVSVDFDTLYKENSDIIAWIYSKDTPINNPIVKADDNSFYLRRDINGKYSIAGTLFMDYRNESDFSDNNTIIYGHNMNNDTMFGSITEYRKQEYFENHPKMYILTPQKEYKVKLIAGATVESTAHFYDLPLGDDRKEKFITELIGKSTFDTEYNYSSLDRYIILSTCSYVFKDARYILVGVLEEL